MIRKPGAKPVPLPQSLAEAHAMVRSSRRALVESRDLLDHVEKASREIRNSLRQSRRAKGESAAVRADGGKKTRTRRDGA